MAYSTTLKAAHHVLTEQDAASIKDRIWHGVKYREIAAEFDVSLSTVQGIAQGKAWFVLPWPDGRTGSLAPERRREINRNRRVGGLPRASLPKSVLENPELRHMSGSFTPEALSALEKEMQAAGAFDGSVSQLEDDEEEEEAARKEAQQLDDEIEAMADELRQQERET